MLTFPNAKINLGLNIGATMPDGYHEIVTVMVPVDWCDVLEIVPSATGVTTLTTSGNPVACPPEKNLVMKAWREFASAVDTPPVDIYLRKIIPDGAGMGGGSADAAFTLLMLNEMTGFPLDLGQLAEMAARLGSDCPLFVHNRPMLATGRGTVLSEADIDLSRLGRILVVKPRGSVSTAEAYSSVRPSFVTAEELMGTLTLPVGEWQGRLVNDFEESVIPRLPEIELIRDWMLASGASYAAMTGSGSAVFGIFPADKMADMASLPVEDCIWRECRPTGV